MLVLYFGVTRARVCEATDRDRAGAVFWGSHQTSPISSLPEPATATDAGDSESTGAVLVGFLTVWVMNPPRDSLIRIGVIM